MKAFFISNKEEFAPILNKNKSIFFVKEKKEQTKFNIRSRVLRSYNQNVGGEIVIARISAIKAKFKPVLLEANIPIKKETTDSVVINEYQSIMINKILELRLNKERTLMGCSVCLLQMNTGLGKTRMGVKLIETLLQKTLIVVPTKHMANQWIDEIDELFSVIIYDNKKNNVSASVVICIINTAREKEQDFYDNFALVILDEVHEYTSTCNKKVLWKTANMSYVVGLSATPDKGDNLLGFIESHLDKTLYTSDYVDVEKISHKWNAHVKIVKYNGHGEYIIPVLNKSGDICSMSTINKIAEDPERIKIIVDEIKKIYELHDSKFAQVSNLRDKENKLLHKHCIYVFAETRDYLSVIKDKLVGYDVSIEDELTILKGGIKKEDIKEAESSRIILTTYGYSRRGISYNNYTSLIFATSRKAKYSIEQVLGRVFRLRGPKDVVRYIVYIWDCNTVFRKHVNNHTEIYEKFGYKYCIK